MTEAERGQKKPNSFEQFWDELVTEVEAEGPEAVAEFELLRTAYRISGDAALRGLTHTDLLLRVLRRSGMGVEDLRRLREEWE